MYMSVVRLMSRPFEDLEFMHSQSHRRHETDGSLFPILQMGKRRRGEMRVKLSRSPIESQQDSGSTL